MEQHFINRPDTEPHPDRLDAEGERALAMIGTANLGEATLISAVKHLERRSRRIAAHSDHEDVVQETLVRGLVTLKGIREAAAQPGARLTQTQERLISCYEIDPDGFPDNFVRLLLRILVNASIDEGRRRQRRARCSSLDQMQESSSSTWELSPAGADFRDQVDDRIDIATMLAKVDPLTRWLCEAIMDGRSNRSELAAKLGLNRSEGYRMVRALHKTGLTR